MLPLETRTLSPLLLVVKVSLTALKFKTFPPTFYGIVNNYILVLNDDYDYLLDIPFILIIQENKTPIWHLFDLLQIVLVVLTHSRALRILSPSLTLGLQRPPPLAVIHPPPPPQVPLLPPPQQPLPKVRKLHLM